MIDLKNVVIHSKNCKAACSNWTGVQPDIIESRDNDVREEHTTKQSEPIDTYSESDSDEKRHATYTSWQN